MTVLTNKYMNSTSNGAPFKEACQNIKKRVFFKICKIYFYM